MDTSSSTINPQSNKRRFDDLEDNSEEKQLKNDLNSILESIRTLNLKQASSTSSLVLPQTGPVMTDEQVMSWPEVFELVFEVVVRCEKTIPSFRSLVEEQNMIERNRALVSACNREQLKKFVSQKIFEEPRNSCFLRNEPVIVFTNFFGKVVGAKICSGAEELPRTALMNTEERRQWDYRKQELSQKTPDEIVGFCRQNMRDRKARFNTKTWYSVSGVPVEYMLNRDGEVHKTRVISENETVVVLSKQAALDMVNKQGVSYQDVVSDTLSILKEHVFPTKNKKKKKFSLFPGEGSEQDSGEEFELQISEGEEDVEDDDTVSDSAEEEEETNSEAGEEDLESEEDFQDDDSDGEYAPSTKHPKKKKAVSGQNSSAMMDDETKTGQGAEVEEGGMGEVSNEEDSDEEEGDEADEDEDEADEDGEGEDMEETSFDSSSDGTVSEAGWSSSDSAKGINSSVQNLQSIQKKLFN